MQDTVVDCQKYSYAIALQLCPQRELIDMNKDFHVSALCASLLQGSHRVGLIS